MRSVVIAGCLLALSTAAQAETEAVELELVLLADASG